MNRTALLLFISSHALLSCSRDLGVPDGYCENECTVQWTENCERDCGISRPRDAGSGDAGRAGSGTGGHSGISGSGAGGGDDGGSSGSSGGAGDGGSTGTGGSSGSTAGDGGMSGDGGDAGGAGDASITPECMSDDDCTDYAEPECSTEGICESCTSSNACSDRGVRSSCDDASGSPTFGECVQCTSDDQCSATEPACVDGVCSPCTDDGPCDGRSATPHCDLDGAGTVGQCVECTDDEHCDNPTPQCGSNRTCGGCTSSAACDFRAGKTDCNTENNATQGQCVTCVASTEIAKCGAKACTLSTGTCSNHNRYSRLSCQTCTTDNDCAMDLKCVDQEFGSDTFGPYCFPVHDATHNCGDMVSGIRPYSDSTSLTSIDGFSADYCMPVTTCEAIEDTTAMGASGGKNCSSNADCGATGAADGYCIETGPGAGQCSYPCDNHYECPGSGFTTCDGITITFCQP